MNQNSEALAWIGRMAAGVLNFAIIAYASGILLYLLAGPIDFRMEDHWPWAPGFRLMIGDAIKPLIVLALIIALRVIVYTLRSEDSQEGKIGQRASAIAGKELGPSLFLVALPVSIYLFYVYTLWPIGKAASEMYVHAKHGANLAKVGDQIPSGVPVYATPGAYFKHFKSREGARLLEGIENEIKEGGNEQKPWFVVDTYLNRSRKDTDALKLLKLPGYHVAYTSEGVYVHAPGEKGKLDYGIYMDNYLSFTASQTDYQVGANAPDPYLPGGIARVAKVGTDKAGFMVYSRYMTLGKGTHQAVFRLKAGSRVEGDVAELNVAADHGHTIVKTFRLKGSDFPEAGSWKEFRFPFTLERENVDTLQLRVIWLGGTDLYFSLLKVEPDFNEFAR